MRFISAGVLIGLALTLQASEKPRKREIPRPLPNHPGNVFLAGETVSVPLRPEYLSGWELRDWEGRLLNGGQSHVTAELGRLPTGYYEIRDRTQESRISLAVCEPLRRPTPLDSPVGLDVGMAWFCPADRMPSMANLCALAGVNWVRDRLSWEVLEPQPNRFAGSEPYESAIQAELDAGLRVLLVNHSSPAWTRSEGPRFPSDLRDVRHFYHEVARRWQGKVRAFEPWNEADMKVFGAHTGSEIAAFQKAAYWGLKTGNPGAIVGLAPLFYHDRNRLADLAANQAWTGFDTFNFHHYAPVAELAGIYADFRAVSGGRPLWVTEGGRPLPWSGDLKQAASDTASLRLQGETLGKLFAVSLHEGAQAFFYFFLPHYVDGKDQFGLLWPDLTPRPSFVALAAVGRLMASAKPLGRQTWPSGDAYGFWFKARPDGQSREVLVCWSDQDTSLDLPAKPRAIYDFLGREVPVSGRSLRLGAGPQYALFPLGTAAKVAMVPPPGPAPVISRKPCPVVIQAVIPKARILADRSAYQVSAGNDKSIALCLYQFGSGQAHGQLRVISPQPALLAERVEIAPDERLELGLDLSRLDATHPETVQTVEIEGDFGSLGKARLSLRLAVDQ